ncbi:MAG TPA: hypothetical protein VL688_04485 [Verrucomicrobiae bacterium]|nr:hypothetical protein [Verrucomicrobiae bacterium]
MNQALLQQKAGRKNPAAVKAALFLGAVNAAALLAYAAWGHALLRAMYDERAWPWLNACLHWRGAFPVSYYESVADLYFWSAVAFINAVFLMAFLAHKAASLPAPVLPRVTDAQAGWLCGILAAVPAAVIFYHAMRYAILVPYQDEWVQVWRIQKVFHGTLTWGDLWLRIGDHHSPFPRLVMVILARLTHWNMRWEVAVNFLFSLGTCAALVTAVFKHRDLLPGRTAFFFLPLFALIVFSGRQQAAWIWGEKTCNYMSVFAAAVCLRLLKGPDFRWKIFAGALAAALVSHYSFAAGTLAWAVGFWMLAFLRYESPSQKIAAFAIWAAACAAANFVYWLDYETTYAPFARQHPGRMLESFLAALGGLLDTEPTAVLKGAAGVLLFPGLAAYGLSRRSRPLAVFFSGLCLWGLGAAFMISVNRAFFGIGTALNYQYVILTYFFWAGLTGLVVLVGQEQSWADFRGALVKAAAAGALGLFLVSAARESWAGLRELKKVGESVRSVDITAPYLDDNAIDKLYYRHRPHVRRLVPVLRELKLTIFNQKS